MGDPDILGPAWLGPVRALAIDPNYAPAIMTVASLEYQYGRVAEAMKLFLSLTTLPHDQELVEVIDKAGDFLLDSNDLANVERLYAAAAKAFPDVAIYHGGLGYCVAQDGRKEEALLHARRAVELEPDNYRHLNDLGYSLMELRCYDEAEQVLQRAVELAPAEYEMARGNLIHLRVRRQQQTREKGDK